MSQKTNLHLATDKNLALGVSALVLKEGELCIY